jgi:hypothetical protein
MILDMFLGLGIGGLLVTGCIIGLILGGVQRSLLSPFRGFRLSLLSSFYVLPMLLEFEKEFLGFIFNLLKWLPMFFLVYWLRPRFVAHVLNNNTITTKVHRLS